MSRPEVDTDRNGPEIQHWYPKGSFGVNKLLASSLRL